MGLEDIVNQAKDALSSNSEAVDNAVDQVKEAVQGVTPDQADGAVEQAAEAIKDQI